MRRYFKITYWEYLEYEQNGCIKVKDYPLPKKQRLSEDESYPFTIYELLDVEDIYNWRPFNDERLSSFSFGTLFMNKEYDAYLIRPEDSSMRPLIKRRLSNHGLKVEDEGEYISVNRKKYYY